MGLKINSKETMLKHVKWAYRTYKGMTDDRKDKKNISCLKSYYGKCECVKGLKIGCTKCKDNAMPGRNKDYGLCIKKTQELPEPHKTKEACEKADCEWCQHFEEIFKVRRRRLGDSAAYLLDRHQQIHGVRTPPVLATLLEEIEEAQRNWRPRRR